MSEYGQRQVECPRCASHAVVRNGHTRHGKQGLRCSACGRQFTADPAVRVSEEIRGVVQRALGLGLTTVQIMEIAGVSAGYVYAVKRGTETQDDG